MDNTEITIGDVEIFKQENKMLYASDSKRRKKIFITLSGTYEVYHREVLMKGTPLTSSAVDYYNSI